MSWKSLAVIVSKDLRVAGIPKAGRVNNCSTGHSVLGQRWNSYDPEYAGWASS